MWKTIGALLQGTALGVLLGLHPGAATASGEGSALRQAPVGYVELDFSDVARRRTLRTKVWYPAVPGTFNQPMAYDHAFFGLASRDAPYEPAPARALVLMSHGDKGSNLDQSWLAEMLASNGYLVAGVSHWKNTWNDFDPAETLRVWQRPKDLSFVLDHLLSDPVWSSRIDRNRIGAAGHSSGGYTALALAGAIYSPIQMGAYCQSPGRGADCGLAKDVDPKDIDFSPTALSYRDVRVRAVLAMAPALGPGLQQASLHLITIPVRLVAAIDDEVLPIDFHAGRIAREIPGAHLTRLAQGGHFVFMPECTWVTKVFTYFKPFDVCGRKSKADRLQVHELVGTEAARFFGDAFSVR